MKISKSIIKKAALVLAGVAAITGVGFGVKAIVDYTKDDLKKITPTFEVGNLGSDGKFVDDEGTLYTKEAFKCDGLQVKLDFDNEIDYQIYYYDDLDNFIESTAVLSDSYSGGVHDSYARIVITPTNDEDGKINLTERVSYPKQMEVKVNKAQDGIYSSFYGRRFKIVDDTSSLRFYHGDFSLKSDSIVFDNMDHSCVTSKDILHVRGGEKVELNYSNTGDKIGVLRVTQIKQVNGNSVVAHYDDLVGEVTGENKILTVDKDTDYLLFKFYFEGSDHQILNDKLDDSFLSSLSSYIGITK